VRGGGRACAGRAFGCSARQPPVCGHAARRRSRSPSSRGVHGQAAGAAGAAVREHARVSGRTISAVVAQALEEFLARAAGTIPQVNDRAVGTEFVFDVTRPRIVGGLRHSRATAAARIRAGQEGRPPRDERGDLRRYRAPGRRKTRRSGRRQRHCGPCQAAGAELPEEWVFEDEGTRGDAVRPRWSGCGCGSRVGVDVCCAIPGPARRKFAYQALLIEEFARAGTRVEFIKGPRGDSPRPADGAVPGHVRRV